MKINLFGYIFSIEKEIELINDIWPKWKQPIPTGPMYYCRKDTYCVGRVQPFTRFHSNGTTNCGVEAYYENEEVKEFSLVRDALDYIETRYKILNK